MQWFPIQYRSSVICSLALWAGRNGLTVIGVIAILRSNNMFANIPDFNIVAAACALAMVCWVAIVQYSRYQQHIKDNAAASVEKQEAARKYAFIPYGFIPLVFGAVSVVGALFCTSWLITKGYVADPEQIAGVALGLTVVITAVLDKFLVRNLGNAVYFDTIEDAIVKSADDALNSISAEDLKLLAVLKQLKN